MARVLRVWDRRKRMWDSNMWLGRWAWACVRSEASTNPDLAAHVNAFLFVAISECRSVSSSASRGRIIERLDSPSLPLRRTSGPTPKGSATGRMSPSLSRPASWNRTSSMPTQGLNGIRKIFLWEVSSDIPMPKKNTKNMVLFLLKKFCKLPNAAGTAFVDKLSQRFSSCNLSTFFVRFLVYGVGASYVVLGFMCILSLVIGPWF